MATRGFIGYRMGHKDFIQYNHSSSNPNYLGKSIFEYAQNMDIARVRERVSQFVLVDEDAKVTKNLFKKACKWLKEGNETLDEAFARLAEGKPTGDGMQWCWSNILGDYAGSLAAWDEGLNLWPDWEGYQYGFDNEWSYLINLDDEVLEVYTGHWSRKGDAARAYHKVRKPNGRYASDTAPTDEKGVLLVGEIPLAELKLLSTETIHRYCERLNAEY